MLHFKSAGKGLEGGRCRRGRFFFSRILPAPSGRWEDQGTARCPRSTLTVVGAPMSGSKEVVGGGGFSGRERREHYWVPAYEGGSVSDKFLPLHRQEAGG